MGSDVVAKTLPGMHRMDIRPGLEAYYYESTILASTQSAYFLNFELGANESRLCLS